MYVSGCVYMCVIVSRFFTTKFNNILANQLNKTKLMGKRNGTVT